MHDVYEDLYEDLEKLDKKNTSLKKKIQEFEFFLKEMQEKFLNVEIAKTSLGKDNEVLKKKNE